MSFAEQHDPDNAASPATTAFSLLDIEHDNLRTALATAVRIAPPTGSGWRPRWGVTGWRAAISARAGGGWTTRSRAVPESSDLRSRALHALAVFDMRRGRIERLGELGAEIVDIHRTLDDRAGLAQALQHEALLVFMRGRWGDCDHRLDECLRVAGDCRDWRVLPSATHLRGLVALSRGHFDTARAALEETRRLLAAAAPTERPGFTVVMLGIVIEHPGTEHAHVLFEETVVQGRSVDPARAVGYLLGNLAYLARLAGDLDEARSYLLDAVEVFQTRGIPTARRSRSITSGACCASRRLRRRSRCPERRPEDSAAARRPARNRIVGRQPRAALGSGG